jgi:hypothetical protein
VEALRLVGILVFLVTSFAVGVRLLVLALHTRQIPELLLGLALFASGALGGILYFVGTSYAEQLGATGPWVRGGGRLFLSTGSLALWAFTWQVFRPDRRWAAALVVVAGSAITVSFVGEGIVSGFSGGNFDTLWAWLGFLARGLAYLWASIESWRYLLPQRRRLRIGLGDPLVADRFQLWGISTLAALGIYGVALANLLGDTVPDLAGGVFESTWALLTSALGLVSGVCVWLAFLPPDRYRRWIASQPTST